MLNRGRFALLFLVLPSLALAQSMTSETEKHVHAVETGLLPAVEIKGEPAPTMTLRERMEFYKVPGVSIAVEHDGRIEWARGYGKVAIGAADVTADTLFQAGSISKPVAAVGTLKLVEQGRLSLDENVNDKLKSWKVPDNEFTKSKAVTLREILTHSGGTTVHGFPGYASGVPVPTLLQVLNGEKPANTAAIVVEKQPGTVWNYSGGGYTIMQQLVIDVTSRPYPQFLRETVLQPIGMTSSTYEQPLPEALRSKAASPYGRGNAISGGAHTYPEMAAAGLWTTAPDLCRFVMAIQHGLHGDPGFVLSQNMTRQMVSKQFAVSPDDDWGLGFEVMSADGHLAFSHGGSNAGFEALFFGTEDGLDGFAIMTNAIGGGALEQEIARAVAHVYGWPFFHPAEKSRITLNPADLRDVPGRYQLNPQFSMLIEAREGKLYLRGPIDLELFAQADGRLFTLDRDFDITVVRENGKVAGLTFSRPIPLPIGTPSSAQIAKKIE